MDIYKKSIELANSLNQCGHSIIAQDILDAINYGSTGTEILMRIRFSLKVLLNSDIGNNLQLLENAHNIVNEINLMID